MSKMIPQATVDVLRGFGDVSVDSFGIDCDLYILNNPDVVDDKDIYAAPSDMTFTHYSAMVWMEWSPNIYRLRKLGIYVEDELPTIARFKQTAQADDETVVAVDVVKGSYVRFNLQYVPDEYNGIEEFEVVNVFTGSAHDAIVSRLYFLAPRRLSVDE